MTEKRYTALVLAASRGNLDPLAQAGGVSHKCFIDIAGQPMLRRVVQAVAESGRFARIIVAIEEEAMAEAREILAPVPGAGDILYVPSKTNIATSVTAVAAAHPDALPLVITTGDNALHTAEMVAHFCDALGPLAAAGYDGAIGLTPARYILDKYPGETRAFHRFRDGAFSSCNIYALMTPRAVERGPDIFRTGGQFGKKPKRLIGAFGLLAFLVYKSRQVSLPVFLRLLGRAIGIRTAPVLMPFAEGPIDVDRMQDWELANRIVAAREAG
ncbi:MAG TPA: NTP transferase domain-containing protein [Allosphingosinicella sp.]|jgi:CTP:molybdopterin cytidylyltransferase MocA